ncbi:MAG: cation:proton antiporter, partial [Caldimicrobium sp.]
NTPYGRYIFGILIFQDLSVIVVMLALPLLAASGISLKDVGITLIRSFGIFILIFLVGAKLIPLLFYQIVKTQARELFLISIFVITLGLAFLSYKLGLSMSLGAFVAGMIISESELVYQTMAEVKPFKEFFLAFFFLVVGALFNISTFSQHLFLTLTAFSVVFIIKVAVVLLVVMFVSKNLRNALLSALYLFQIGEFSFVLALEGKKLNLMPEDLYQIFISLSILSLALTPFVISISYQLSDFVLKKLVPKKFAIVERRRRVEKKAEEVHTIVVGFGVCGRNVAFGLKLLKIPYIVLELNLATVKHYRKKGEPIYFADATYSEILKKFGIEKAKVLVIAIGDSFAVRKIIKIAKTLNPHIYIIARSQFVAEIDELLNYGADEVISEEFEASLELFVKVLEYYKVPKNEIFHLVEQLRSQHYEALRSEDLSRIAKSLPHEWWKLFKVQTYLIKEKSPLIGLTLGKLNLKAKTGATVISIQRGEELLPNPSADTSLQEGDLLILIGEERALNNAIRYLDEPYEALY